MRGALRAGPIRFGLASRFDYESGWAHYPGGMTIKVKRRLTTILCADVEGYSRLMEADETGTLSVLRRHRTAMGTLIDRHDGRIINTWGDAIIAELLASWRPCNAPSKYSKNFPSKMRPFPTNKK